jgi:putative ABC transport system substrate-binding protein
MQRREFLTFLGGSMVAWPRAARAQKAPMPVVGFLSSSSPALYTVRLSAFSQGLKDAGYVEGQNVEIEYRWAEDQNSRLSVLAAELVQRQVDVIVAGGGTPAAVAAKAATTTTPIIFELGADPVRMGFVAFLTNRFG